MAYVADIETIQLQLAKPAPNKDIIGAAWQTVKAAATINGCVGLVTKVGALVGGLLT